MESNDKHKENVPSKHYNHTKTAVYLNGLGEFPLALNMDQLRFRSVERVDHKQLPDGLSGKDEV